MKQSNYKYGILTISLVSLFACQQGNKQNEFVPTTSNPAQFVTNEKNLEMLQSLESLDSLGRIYLMDYTADYKLDEMLKDSVVGLDQLQQFVAKNFFDTIPSSTQAKGFGAGCSMFATINPNTGDKLMGRNYDFCHVEQGKEVPITALVIKTAPTNGKKSICIGDTYWLGYHCGFYTDGKSDLSMLMAAPYCILDGINEDGFAMGVLHLEGEPTLQNEPNKPSIWTTVAMRMLIDRASTVDEAIDMLKQYNMNMDSPAKGSYHFFMADSTGDYAIVEYAFRKGADLHKDTPDSLITMKGQDFSYVTNFYVDPGLAEDEWLGGKATHGKARYDTLRTNLVVNAYKLSEEDAMKLLGKVATDSNPQENTSHTQWSALYNLTKKSLGISILKEYDKKVTFKL